VRQDPGRARVSRPWGRRVRRARGLLRLRGEARGAGQNVRSLGFDLEDLERRNLLVVDYVQIERSEIEETGEYDLEGLFLRLGFAIDSIGAKRVGLDTLETLFGNLGNEAILRAELRRLFRWLKDRGVTASSPPSGATERSPATGSKSTSRTA